MKKLLLVLAAPLLVFGCTAANDAYRGDLGPVMDNHVLGDVTAPVQVVEYTDFECSFCGSFHNETFRKIKENYVSTGKASFVIKDFPLISVHRNSFDAAKGAYCAGDQDKYWEMVDKMFGNQGSLRVADLVSYAEVVEVENLAKFEACVRSDKYDSVIEDNLVEGANAGVKGPPTFYVNDVLIEGARSFEVFEEVIEAELAK